MRYLLVDRVTAVEPGVSIRGVKNVAMSEDFLEFHFPRHPIMPGIMLLEALVQLCGWLEAVSSDFGNWFLISKVNKCNFYGFVFPGDQVELEVRRVASETGRSTYSAIGKVDGKKKIKGEFEGEITPLSDFEDPEEQRRFYGILIREQT